MPTFGRFGANTDDFERTAFLRWFHLTDRSVVRPGCHRYRPDGAAFRDRVALDVELAPANTIASLALAVDRAFIDDARDGAFAADITSSFFETIVGSHPDAKKIEPLIVKLQHIMIDRPTAIARVDALPPVAPLAEFAPVIDAYEGRAQRSELAVADVRLELTNTVVTRSAGPHAVFRIVAMPRSGSIAS